MPLSIGSSASSDVVNSRPVDVTVTKDVTNFAGLLVLVSASATYTYPPDSTIAVTFDPGGANEVVLTGASSGLLVHSGPLGPSDPFSAPVQMIWFFTKQQLQNVGAGSYTVRYTDTASGSNSFGTVIAALNVLNTAGDVSINQTAVAFNSNISASSVTTNFSSPTQTNALSVAVVGNSTSTSMNIPQLANSVFDLTGGATGDAFCASYEIKNSSISSIQGVTDGSQSVARISMVAVEIVSAVPDITTGVISTDTVDSVPPLTRSVTLANPCDGLIVVVSTGSTFSPWPIADTVYLKFDPNGANEVTKTGFAGLATGTGFRGDSGNIAGSGGASSMIWFFSKNELPSSGTFNVTYYSNNTTDGTMMACIPITANGAGTSVRQVSIGYTNNVSLNSITAVWPSTPINGNLLVAVATNTATSSMSLLNDLSVDTQFSNYLFDVASSQLAGNSFVAAYEKIGSSPSGVIAKTDNAGTLSQMSVAALELQLSGLVISRYPNILISVSGVTGTYTDIDEDPASPDGNWLLNG